ncbi:hypothetical protein Dda_1063 [Drechslerella dactyloides]|uniref:Uncharacterized protein n=1 Tax=Drechslerella dactyloides TaxID=74499 RepID=A0AAD6NNV8_DREDA|nr:hypothetical protein Dda_1063 [Drechslerella dactyloides]
MYAYHSRKKPRRQPLNFPKKYHSRRSFNSTPSGRIRPIILFTPPRALSSHHRRHQPRSQTAPPAGNYQTPAPNSRKLRSGPERPQNHRMAYEVLIVLAPLASIGAATLIIVMARGISLLMAHVAHREQMREAETRFYGRPLKRRERRAMEQLAQAEALQAARAGYTFQPDEVLPGYSSQ